MVSVVTPVSHLFRNSAMAQLIADNSDFLEFRDHSPQFDSSKQILFHTDLEPAHKLTQDDFEYLEKIAKSKPNLELVSFHLASCYHNPILENGLFMPGGYCYSSSEMISNARKNFPKIKEIFGPGIKIAIENNNHYETPAYAHITDPEFISDLLYTNEISFLYDIAHAKVSSHNMGITYEAYKNKLPLDKAIQIHICKSGVRDGMAYDAHFLPDMEEWNEIKMILTMQPQIQYLTIEYYKEIEGLIQSLQYLKREINNE